MQFRRRTVSDHKEELLSQSFCRKLEQRQITILSHLCCCCFGIIDKRKRRFPQTDIHSDQSVYASVQSIMCFQTRNSQSLQRVQGKVGLFRSEFTLTVN